MKDVNSFIGSMVKIEFIEQSGCFGHYPFYMFEEQKDGQNVINSLALGGNVIACYDKFCHSIKDGSKRVYMALDFPKRGDIKHDFVAVFSWENEKLEVIAIPYDEQSGDVFDMVENSEHLEAIKNQLSKNI